MTVSELRAQLRRLPGEAKVYIYLERSQEAITADLIDSARLMGRGDGAWVLLELEKHNR